MKSEQVNILKLEDKLLLELNTLKYKGGRGRSCPIEPLVLTRCGEKDGTLTIPRPSLRRRPV